MIKLDCYQIIENKEIKFLMEIKSIYISFLTNSISNIILILSQILNYKYPFSKKKGMILSSLEESIAYNFKR